MYKKVYIYIQTNKNDKTILFPNSIPREGENINSRIKLLSQEYCVIGAISVVWMEITGHESAIYIKTHTDEGTE